MDCKYCGLRIERLPVTASEVEFVHAEKVNGAKVVTCAFANPLSPASDFYNEKQGYLVAEPLEQK